MDPWFLDETNRAKNKLQFHDGIYWMGKLMVVPNAANLRPRILREFHDTMAGGHFGEQGTGEQLTRCYSWPG